MKFVLPRANRGPSTDTFLKHSGNCTYTHTAHCPPSLPPNTHTYTHTHTHTLRSYDPCHYHSTVFHYVHTTNQVVFTMDANCTVCETRAEFLRII